MNALVAKNVRTIRELKHWTQHHLADAAGVELRTVQRVEAGQGVSVDTLAALASAFDTTIEILGADFAAAAAELEKEYGRLKKTHDIIPVTAVTCSTDLAPVGQVQAYLMECVTRDDATQDAFAALKSDVVEMVDLWNHVPPEQHREWVKTAFAKVEKLNELGLVVCLGKAKHAIRTRTRPIEFLTLYVVAWPKGEEKTHIAVDKSA
jgi:transcriptional regulator with XRE-family HTH domain